ncbi:MAG TPA: UDP-N-acetylmuramoyl-tripeptide--D-alanyl-D-alanine ligase [Flavobacteriales bacterium]|nr:UDP-N-acetylmuramoyl-tripeptide--D-alanyl-D-alanine ligase [Flavobacteriales bacterium]
MNSTVPQLHDRFLTCEGISTDTRTIGKGSMFFALKGPNFNANAFAVEALAKGARIAVVDDASIATDDRFLLVADVLRALQDLATHHRRGFNIPVIAITGTNGKTTTKELVHAVLSANRATLATTGNLNNHIGVPLTLLKLKPDHKIAIIEMGASKRGDIAELCAIAEPTHGSITNIGKAHLEGFGSVEGVITAKTEMYGFLSGHQGTLFVNSDDELLMAKSSGMDRITFGSDPNADTFGEIAGNGPFLEFVFGGRDGHPYHVKTELIGHYNLYNALSAVAIGQYFELPDERIAYALSTYTPSNSRSQFKDTGRNHLILDAYNANPTSMKAALENFATMDSTRSKLAFIGDMLELGSVSETEHRSIVELVEQLGLEARFVGPEFKRVTTALDSAAALVDQLRTHPVKDHVILVKGSRGIKLESVVDAL